MFGLGLLCSNTTFNNISVIPWRSVLLVEKTGVPRENHCQCSVLTSFITIYSKIWWKIITFVFISGLKKKVEIKLDENYKKQKTLFLIRHIIKQYNISSKEHYVIKFVSDLPQVDGFLRFPPPIKLTATI